MCFIFKVTSRTGLRLKANYSGLLVSQPGYKEFSLFHPGQRKKSKWATKENKVYHPYLKPTGIPFTTKTYLLQNNGNRTQEFGPCVQLNTGSKLIHQEASQNTGACHTQHGSLLPWDPTPIWQWVSVYCFSVVSTQCDLGNRWLIDAHSCRSQFTSKPIRSPARVQNLVSRDESTSQLCDSGY